MVDRHSSSPPGKPRTKTLDGLPRPRSRPSFPSPSRGGEAHEIGRRLRLSSPPLGAQFKTAGARGSSSTPELKPIEPALPPAPAAPRLELEALDSWAPPASSTARNALEPLDSLLPSAPAAPRLELEPIDPYPPLLSEESGERIPEIIIAPAELQGLDIDHRAGFLLSLIDGMTSVDDLMELSGMPVADARALLERLIELGAITLR